MTSENIYSIYLITNLINHKKYVGYTSNKLGHRFNDHCKIAKPKYQDRSTISLAIEKNGRDNFSCQVIFQSKDYDYCRQIETDFIKEYNTLTSTLGGHGYNIDLGGKGHKRSIQTIEKHRAKLLGRKQTEEHKKRKGFKAGNQIGKKNSGKKRTEEQKQKTRQIQKELYATGSLVSHMTGKTFKVDYPDSLLKMKQTIRDNRINTNKFKNIVVKNLDTGVIYELDHNYQDFFKLHNLNNFMTVCIKNPSRIIKNFILVSYELNR